MRGTMLSSTIIGLFALANVAGAQLPTQAVTAGSGYYPPPVAGGYGWGCGYRPAATVASGYLMGWASVLEAAGQYNYNTAVGLSFAEDAWGKHIVNRGNAVEAYYNAKKSNADYQVAARGPRPTKQQLVTISKVMAPKRMTVYEIDQATGTINWPAVLRWAEFDAYRTRLDDLFSKRDVTSGLGSSNYEEIVYLTNNLQDDLKSLIDTLTPAEYMAAKRFLTSLNHEARFAPTVEGVAVR